MNGGGAVDPQVGNTLGQIQNQLKNQDMKMDKIKSDLKDAGIRDGDISTMVETMRQELLEAMEKERKDKAHEHG